MWKKHQWHTSVMPCALRSSMINIITEQMHSNMESIISTEMQAINLGYDNHYPTWLGSDALSYTYTYKVKHMSYKNIWPDKQEKKSIRTNKKSSITCWGQHSTVCVDQLLHQLVHLSLSHHDQTLQPPEDQRQLNNCIGSVQNRFTVFPLIKCTKICGKDG